MQKLQIDPTTWATLNRLLDEALEQPTGQLDRWLDDLPAQFAPLRPRLRELLAHSGAIETHEFMHTLPKLDLTPGDLASAAVTSEQPGQEIGPYRLTRELGSGGMGVVWLAERTDGLIQRPVALKLPHGAWKRAGLAERMAREREILATLTHPNIAHLYDAGVTPDGRPYLAIEFVEGERIDLYCRHHRLDVRARLSLFSQVASAVAYAHGKLVVHRDLKPANILVSAGGHARLLDFGIAKLLDEGSVRETRLTESSGRALTPDYASPEQILGEPLTIASDVYSLGVVLYELLSGERPYKPRRGSRGALEEAIVQTESAPPSEMLAADDRKQLRGDLDTVVLKALKKNPAHRYPTVHALLDDIERYLGSRPVLAQPDGRWYRARKFVARNKLAVASATAIFLAVLLGAGIATWQARVALAQKNRAEWQSQLVRSEQRRAEQARDFIADVFRRADPAGSTGRVYSAADLLRQAERRLQRTPDEDPRLHLELLDIIGESMFGLQQHEDSARVLQQALQFQRTHGVADDALSARLHLGVSRSYELLGRLQEAKTEVEHALQILTDSRNTKSTLFAQAKIQQAAMGILLAEYETAEQAALAAIAAAKSAQGGDSPEVANALQQLSHVFTLTQRRQEAVEPARQAFELQRRLHAGDLAHPKLLEAGMYYAQSQHSAGDFEAASALYTDTVARARQVFGADSHIVGELLGAQVSAETDRGNLDAAIRIAEQALSIYIAQSERGSVIHGNRVRLLGTALLAARKLPEAETRLNEAVELTTAAKANLEATHSRLNLGLALAYLGRFSEAQAVLGKVLDKPVSSASRAQHLAMRNMGTMLRLQGRPREALQWLDSAIEGASIQPSHRGDLAHGLLEAGLARLDLGEHVAAEALLSRATALFADVQRDRMTPARAELHVAWGRLAMARGDCPAAVPSLRQAHQFWQRYDPRSVWAKEAATLLDQCRRKSPSPYAGTHPQGVTRASP